MKNNKIIEFSFQERLCEACLSNQLEEIFIFDHVVRTINHKYYFRNRNVICKNCGFVFVSPCPSQKDLTMYYEDTLSKFSYQPPTYNVDKRFNVLIKYGRKDNSVLEIGGNIIGEFSSKCSQFFSEASMVELNNECSSQYQTLSRVPSQRYDIIVHYYVLEHATSPQDFIVNCSRILKPDGIMICEVPDLRKYQEIAAELIWFEHMNHFTPDKLCSIAARNGFNLVSLSQEGLSDSHGFLAVFRKDVHQSSSIRQPINEYKDSLEYMKKGELLFNQFIRQIKSLQNKIIKMDKSELCVIYCANDITRRICAGLEKERENIIIIDDDPRKEDFIDNFIVYPSSSVKKQLKNTNFLVVCSRRLSQKIIKRVEDIKRSKIEDIDIIDYY